MFRFNTLLEFIHTYWANKMHKLKWEALTFEVVPNIFILLLKEGALFSLLASAQSIDGNRLRVHEIRHLQRWSIILTEHVFAYIYLWLPHKASVSFKLCVIIWVSKKSAVKMSIILMVGVTFCINIKSDLAWVFLGTFLLLLLGLFW